MGSLRVPEAVPPPDQDCERLKKAFDGFGTDEEAVIWVLGHRNASQRRKIRELINSFTISPSLIVSVLNSLEISEMQ
ncbi:hypothetical protein M0R45_036730 [Rubus argutus]|uniref:Uncharacterized protein n=1 Tax=Rubus argutus TaxID=59490 RepID=A0AAW1W0G9_RUBAR